LSSISTIRSLFLKFILFNGKNDELSIEHRRKLVHLQITLALLVLLSLPPLINAIMWWIPLRIVLIGPLTITSLFLLLLPKKLDAINLYSWAAVLLCTLAITQGIFTNGGLHSTNSAFLPVVPLLAGLLINRRAAAIVFMMVIFVVLSAIVCDKIGVELPNLTPLEHQYFQSHFILVLACLAAFLLTMAYRSSVDQSQAQYRETIEKLDASNRVKADFINNIQHEFRTPLNIILGTLDAFERGTLSSSQLQQLDNIQIASESQLGLINDILDFSKLERQKLEIRKKPVDVKRLVRRLALLHTNHSVNDKVLFRIHVNSAIHSRMLLDEDRCFQVLHKILDNAQKYTEEGEILFTTYGYHDKQGQYWITFQIEDTGVGIKKEELEEIIKPFKQVDSTMSRRYDGMGFGLSLANYLVNAMGGNLLIQSLFGKGTCVSIILPSQLIESTPSQSPSYPNKKVMIVDDNQINLLVAEQIMSQFTTAITTCLSGEKAVAMAKEQDFDLILMDLQMPDKDGYETAFEIHQAISKKAVPIIALSANVPDTNHPHYPEFSEYIAKPIRIEEIQRILQQHFT